MKRREWRSAWGGRERESEREKERESARMHEGERESERKRFGSSFYMFFPPPGPALCKLGLARSAVLPEVFTLVLGPSFDLPCLLATAILDSFSLFYLPNIGIHNGLTQGALPASLCLCLGAFVWLTGR